MTFNRTSTIICLFIIKSLLFNAVCYAQLCYVKNNQSLGNGVNVTLGDVDADGDVDAIVATESQNLLF